LRFFNIIPKIAAGNLLIQRDNFGLGCSEIKDGLGARSNASGALPTAVVIRRSS
jgi:hypothetical protein